MLIDVAVCSFHSFSSVRMFSLMREYAIEANYLSVLHNVSRQLASLKRLAIYDIVFPLAFPDSV